MKSLLTGNDNRIKRRVSAVMAVVIVLTTIGSITYLRQRTVQAKETLYSIEKVIDDLRIKKTDYRILEIVPDTVQGNVEFEYVSENQTGNLCVGITQYPGFLGYYVGGSEPVRDDVDDIVNGSHLVSFNGTDAYETTLDDSTLRYKTVEAVYDALRNSDIYDNDKDKRPFSLSEGYSEVRQGEYIKGETDEAGYVISDYELETGIADGKLRRIERDYIDYVDNARGFMTLVEAGNSDAHYVLKYIPDMIDVDMIDDNDPAYMFMNEYRDYCIRENLSTNNIYYNKDNDLIIKCVVSGNAVSEDSIDEDSLDGGVEDEEERLWQFDPYLTVDTDAADIYAVFAPISLADELSENVISCGYRIVDIAKVDKDDLPALGTPVYKYNTENGKYEYYRDCDDVFIQELTAEENSETNDETEGQTENSDSEGLHITSKDILRDTANTERVSKLSVNALVEDTVKSEIEEQSNGLIKEGQHNLPDGTDEIRPIDEMQVFDGRDENTIDSSKNDSLEYDEKYVLHADEKSDIEDAETGYYTLTFEYFDEYTPSDLEDEDTGFYSVKVFRYTDDEDIAQYSLALDKGLLVPNLMNEGVISINDESNKDNLICEYKKNSGLCNLRWSGDETSEEVFRIVGAKIYYKYGIENHEWFKRYVFDRDCYPYDVDDIEFDTGSKIDVKVVRKTASGVKPVDHQDKGSDIIGKTSGDAYTYRMIALMAGNGAYCVPGADYKQYGARVRDISSDVYTQILNRVYKTKDSVPIIVDHSIIDNEVFLPAESKDSLMYNLAYALSFENAEDYANLVSGMGGSIESGRLANSDYSPLKYASDHGSNILNYNNGDYVNKNIYMYNRKDGTTLLNILNKRFDEPFSQGTISGGFKEVEEDIANEKKIRDADISLKNRPLTHDKVTEATVIRYIIGCENSRSTVGKGVINVLELEPTRCFDLSVTNTDITDQTSNEEFETLKIEEEDDEGNPIEKVYHGKLFYKDKDSSPIVDQRGLKINLKQMTTAEFVGHVEDLNATYDLIYIGMNTGDYKTSNNPKEEKLLEVNEKPSWDDYKALLPEPETIVESGYNQNGDGYHYQERKVGNILYKGWNVWGKSLKIEKWEIISESSTIEETYGGFHHRLSTVEDVSKGRALSVNQVITDFNDDNMDGLVYCNVGDMSYISETVGGSLKVWTGSNDSEGNKIYTWPEYVGEERYLNKEDERNHNETLETHVKGYDYISFTNDPDLGYNGNYSLYRTRYSGNDITNDNMNALIDFSRAGFPIILADGFYSEYDIETRKGTINTCTVDNSSYMYKAVSKINEESSDKNVFNQASIPADLFKWYVLDLGKPIIEMTESESKTAQKSTVYLGEDQKTADGHYNAYFRFRINSMSSAGAATKYNVGLFIDINADGKYSEKNEGIAFSSIKDYGTSATISPIGTDPETKMPIYSLESEHEYEASCKLSGSFVGCLPWRICVSQLGNPYRRNNADGFYAIRNRDRSVRILQIRQNDGYTWDMKEDYNTEGSNFKRLITDTEYMPFKITGKDKVTEGPDSITVEEFEDDCYVGEKTQEGYYKYLQDNYDMVILGFADVYHGPNITAAKGIKKYIENGYSVLFTHDCTSFVNAYSRTSRTQSHGDVGLLGDNWGYEFNSLIRNIVGMDRYDVLAESTHENEKPYKPRSSNQIVLDYEAHGFTYHIINHWGYQSSKNVIAPVDMSYIGRPDGHNGDEYPQYLAWDGNGNRNNNGFSDDEMLQYNNFVGASLGSGQYGGTTYVSQINKGQITQYPYVLKDRFPVAQTHSQYYQLDLTADDDHDDESDIVVWYCISDVTDDPADWSRSKAGLHTSEKNMYNISPNDVRNNYYIYNKGNVTYSGVGHSKPTGEDEIKLFINTMIASFRTGLHEPDLAVVDSYREDPNKVRHLYVSYDDEIRRAVVSGDNIVDDGTDPEHNIVNIVNPSESSDVTKVNKNSNIDNSVDMYFNAEQVSLVQNASSIDHGLYARVFLKDDSAAPEHTIGYYCGDEYVDAQFRDIGVIPIDLTDRVFAKDSDTALEVISGRTNTTLSENGIVVNEEFMNGCVRVSNGVTYKVKVPVTANMLWGGSEREDSEYENIRNTRDIYVVVRDYASYKNTSGQIYKVSLTHWAVDKVDLKRVEVFDLD